SAWGRLVLAGRRGLGTGHAGDGIEKMWILAEPAIAARHVDDRAVPAAVDQQRLGIVAVTTRRGHAIVVRAAVGNAAEIGDEPRVVAPVRARLAGIARRLHAGRSAQRLDADAGIVGQCRQPGAAAGMTRLGQRVLDEARTRLPTPLRFAS